MRTRIEPTPEQLEAAWLQRRRRDWPPTLAAVMAVPLLAGPSAMATVLLLASRHFLLMSSATAVVHGSRAMSIASPSG